MRTVPLAVLASGGGSNFEAIADYMAGCGPAAGARVAVLISNRAKAGAIAKAETRNIPVAVLSNPADPAELLSILRAHGAEFIALAGYLKLVPREVVQHFEGRVVNVHPSLLPAFGGSGMYGARVHEAVLKSGAGTSGVTVHLVDEEYDRGAILAQWPVPVLHGDTPQTLAARVLEVEHVLYPRIVCAAARGEISAAAPLKPAVDAGHRSNDPAAIARELDRLLGLC